MAPPAEPAAKGHIIYCTTNCFGAPFPDAEGRPIKLSVLCVSEDGSTIACIQETDYPAGSGCPMVLALNKSKTKLFTIAGANGIAVFDVNPADAGKVTSGPVCSPTAAETMPTPLGNFPAWVTVDPAEENVFVANFFQATLTALPFDKATCKLGDAVESKPVHPGTPQKVLDQIDPNAEPGPFGAGFPENGCHPHGMSIHPSGKWIVLG